ncbi:MAG: IS110 family transposase [Caulobacterales bacterium]
MPCYVGLDCSKHTTSICVLDQSGDPISEGVTETSPKAIAGFLRGKRRRYALIGIEAATAHHWLYQGLVRAKFPIVCIEAYHAHGVLNARRNKTDKNDARGIAEMMLSGIYKEVHHKSLESRRLRMLLSARRLLLRRQLDLEKHLCAAAQEFGLKLSRGGTKSFEQRALAVAKGEPVLEELATSLLRIRRALIEEVAAFEARILREARSDPVCRRLMTVPGVGPFAAVTFRAAVDDPTRFAHSRDVGAHFGLTPRTYQSGQVDRRGRISKRGDPTVRTVLFLRALLAVAAHDTLRIAEMGPPSRRAPRQGQGRRRDGEALGDDPSPDLGGRDGIPLGRGQRARARDDQRQRQSRTQCAELG